MRPTAVSVQVGRNIHACHARSKYITDKESIQNNSCFKFFTDMQSADAANNAWSENSCIH